MSAFLSGSELRKRGWTTTLIRKLLAQPDETFSKNKSKINLYAKSRVLNAENTEEFKKQANGHTTKRSGKSGVIFDKVMLENIILPLYSKEELTTTAFEAYKKLHSTKATTPLIWDEENTNRIIVNYLKHNFRKYHKILEMIRDKKESDMIYMSIKKKILEKIKITYPYLEHECNLQLDDLLR